MQDQSRKGCLLSVSECSSMVDQIISNMFFTEERNIQLVVLNENLIVANEKLSADNEILRVANAAIIESLQASGEKFQQLAWFD